MNPSDMDHSFPITPGAGGLPRLALTAPDAARAEVYLHGAHVTSWVPAGGVERLFLSRASEFRPGAAIRGGVPVIFPQFSDMGPLPKHGFARTVRWEFAGAQVAEGRASATFRLRDTEDSRRLWPNPFLAELSVSVGGSELAVRLEVTNAGVGPFSFTAALHTYLAVADIATAQVEGLAGFRYRDTAAGGIEGRQASPRLDFRGEVDRIYFDAPDEVHLVEPDRTTLIRSAGFPDAVAWNPGPTKSAAMHDLEPEGYRRFVCVEAAVVGTPVHLARGERWQGTQTLVA